MKYKNLTLNIANDAYLHPFFSKLVNLIPFIAPLDKLITDATQDGPITIDFVTRAESPTGGHFSQRGEIRGNQRSIQRSIKVVSEGKTFAEMLQTLVFELCNAKNPHFVLFSENAIEINDYDRDSYAYMKESAEYSETHVPFKAILKEIFSDADVIHMFGTVGIKFDQDELQQFTATTFKDFEDWWKHVNTCQLGEPHPHAEFYRREHDRAMGQQQALQQVPARRPLPAPPPRHGQPITHARRGFGEHSHNQDVFVEVDITEAELLAQAEIIASFEAEVRTRRGRF